jgi:hypothetical protein
MALVLEEIRSRDLTVEEKEAILAHAADLHLLGSDEDVDVGFDLLTEKETEVEYLLRIKSDGANAGVIYVFPFGKIPNHLEMTILLYPPFRGQHLTSQAVSSLENYLSSKTSNLFLCATVRDHNPLRKELTGFLLKHGYDYRPEHGAFVKLITQPVEKIR